MIPVIIYNYDRKYAVPLFLGHPVYKYILNGLFLSETQ